MLSGVCSQFSLALVIVIVHVVLQSERAALVEFVPSTPPRLSIESKRAQTIDFESFVDEFDARYQNRKLALH